MMINAIITGTTGMVGEGVLHECLAHPGVERILLLSRRRALEVPDIVALAQRQ